MAGDRKPGAKGYELEEALRLYFLRIGLFAVRSVPIVIRGEEITDIDLWLYERPSGSMRRRLLVDAKAKTRPRAAERLLWAKGAQEGLGLDGAYVATTDKRPVLRDIARQFDVLLLDGVDLERISASVRSSGQDRLSEHELLGAIREVDSARHCRDWMDAIRLAKSALVDGLGAAGANRAIDQFAIFAHGAAAAYPNSAQSAVAVRAAFLCAAICAINLDFVFAGVAFRPSEERHRTLVNAIRYGSQDKRDGQDRARMAIALVRQFLRNGKAAASQLERSFQEQANSIPAEIIADTLMKMQRADQIFAVGRELEAASYVEPVSGFDELSLDAKAFVGALLDFVSCSREAFADALTVGSRSTPPDLVDMIELGGSKDSPDRETGESPKDATATSDGRPFEQRDPNESTNDTEKS